jgi:hypothetical protein
MNLPSQSQLLALGRHVVSYTMGGVTVLGVLHVVNGGDVATLTNSINQISQGVALIAAGLGPIIAIASGLWSMYTASPKQQISAVNTADNGVKVVAASTLAPTVTAPLK